MKLKALVKRYRHEEGLLEDRRAVLRAIRDRPHTGAELAEEALLVGALFGMHWVLALLRDAPASRPSKWIPDRLAESATAPDPGPRAAAPAPEVPDA